MTIMQIGDGASNTMALTEGYYYCSGVVSPLFGGGPPFTDTRVDDWNQLYAPGSDITSYVNAQSYKTFQVRPTPAQCDPTIPNSPYSGGILVSMHDGSVRFVSQGVSWQTWLAAFTPGGGDLLGSDW
jgi:hypothetical protein